MDSLLVVSFGGPDAPDDVMPFLRNVTHGRNVPDGRLAEVAEHYYRLGGRSPLNDQVRALIGALQSELDRNGPALPIYWGNRNWNPLLQDTLAKMVADGRRHAVAFVTSPYSSYSSCKQYREDVSRAQAAAGPDAPVIDKIRQYYNSPGFIGPMVRNARKALAKLPVDVQAGTHLVFTAHSVPASMAQASRYVAQLTEASRLVAEGLGTGMPWELVFQSRSGSPQTPWLEPDVCDHLETLARRGASGAVLVPIGFISDHVEVLYDLDVEAMETARELNLPVTRAATVGTDSEFVETIRSLICEVIETNWAGRFLGQDGPVGCLGGNCCVVA